MLLTVFLISSFASAGVYKWVDKEGNVHYGDTVPPDGLATEVDLPESSRYKPRPLPSSVTEVSPAKTPDEIEKPANYPVVKIVKPENAGTVRSNEGIVTVDVQLEPALAKGHVMAFFMDGTLIPDKVASTSFRISNVDRGTHSLVATVEDEQGKELGRSGSITFTLRKTSLFEHGDAVDKDKTGNDDQTGNGDQGGNDDQAGEQPPDESRDSAPFTPRSDPDYDPSDDQIPSTPGVTNPSFDPDFAPATGDQFVPPPGGISTTPGQTNPAFAPKYAP